jgi:D-glycero-D-manno-heptose 1,7-bisphosphate phosphatase
MRPSGKLHRAVFLDRDGVINRVVIHKNLPYPPKTIQELVLLNGVIEAISLLHQNGLTTVVITNQPDVARGNSTLDSILVLHKKISLDTGLQNFYICIHDDFDKCECRKPKIGLIKQAALDLNLDVSNSFIVGDRWKDIEAGQLAGCQCFFIDNNYNERQPVEPFQKVDSLLEAALIITKEMNAKFE